MNQGLLQRSAYFKLRKHHNVKYIDSTDRTSIYQSIANDINYQQ